MRFYVILKTLFSSTDRKLSNEIHIAYKKVLPIEKYTVQLEQNEWLKNGDNMSNSFEPKWEWRIIWQLENFDSSVTATPSQFQRECRQALACCNPINFLWFLQWGLKVKFGVVKGIKTTLDFIGKCKESAKKQARKWHFSKLAGYYLELEEDN